MSNCILKRPTIVDGIFYSNDKNQLENLIKSLILTHSQPKKRRPFALICPYASYLYAGEIFACSYSQIINEDYDTIIIISPIHKIAFPAIALSESDYFSSPLGDLEIDKEANNFLHNYNNEFIIYGEKYHLQEHSIEVQLPFLSLLFNNKVKILPIIMGENNTKFTILLSKALKSLIDNIKKRYLIICVTNLSHNQKYEIAKQKDSKFGELLLKMNADYLAEQLALSQVEAYGGGGVITLLRLVELLKYNNVDILKIKNSGDITDDKNKVEGYISAVF